MKIEMGESLFYSWLRHVKECQIVQMNWKASNQWTLHNEEAIQDMLEVVDAFYNEHYGFKIFKQNTSLSQILKQGEIDLIGTSIQPDATTYYAIEVAFHENGINYGSRDTTVMKIVEKCARAAFSLYGYMNTKHASIIFASPKINPSVLAPLEACIKDLNALFAEHGYAFTFRIIANEDFKDHVLDPILLISGGVADTSELFLRSYQMYQMFDSDKGVTITSNTNTVTDASRPKPPRKSGHAPEVQHSDMYSELKIGQLARTVLRPMLRDGYATEEEIELMQTAEYSKKMFDLQYPLLQEATEEKTSRRYYAEPFYIYGKRYRLCSEWFENENNNDRPYILAWIENHLNK